MLITSDILFLAIVIAAVFGTDEWLEAKVTLSSGTRRAIFTAVRGGTSEGEPFGDIAIDDVKVSDGACDGGDTGGGDTGGNGDGNTDGNGDGDTGGNGDGDTGGNGGGSDGGDVIGTIPHFVCYLRQMAITTYLRSLVSSL